MRLNGVPIQKPPGAWSAHAGKVDEKERRRRAEEADALAAMAQQPVFQLNDREPDCLSARCLEDGMMLRSSAVRRQVRGHASASAAAL